MESQQVRQVTRFTKVIACGGVMLGCLASSIMASGADDKIREGAVIKTAEIQMSTEDNNQQIEVASSSSVTDTSSSQVESTPDSIYQVTSSVVDLSSSKVETETKVKEENEEDVESVIEEEEENVNTDEETFIPENTWEGDVLDQYKGTVQGPSGTEVYYNLYMGVCVQELQNLGFKGSHWVRYDGVQMFGDYVMVAANLDYRPKGTILLTSLGWAIVADDCEAAYWGDPYLLDISVTW